MTWQTWAIHLTWAIKNFVGALVFFEVFNLKYRKWLCTFLYAVGATLFSIARAYSFIYAPHLPAELVFFVVIIPLHSYVFFRLSCSDTPKKIIFYTLLVYSLAMFSSIVAYFIYYLVFDEYHHFDFVSNSALLFSTFGMVAIILFYSVFLFVSKRYVGIINAEIPNMSAFIVIVGAQLIYAINQFISLQTIEINLLSVVAMLGMLVGNIVVLQILLTNSKKKEMEDELREARHAMELEQAHYLEVEKRRGELSKIRHDFNNQLASIGQLIRAGEESSVQDMISSLSKEIVETKENPYCNIPVINAILIDKAQTCSELGIGLAVNLELPPTITVEQMHLCSIFGNLLDNAITACKQVSDKPTIQLSTMVDGDYLFIKAANPTKEPQKKPAPGRGQGSRILSDLAARYGGDYRAEYKDGVFTAVVSLLAVDEP